VVVSCGTVWGEEVVFQEKRGAVSKRRARVEEGSRGAYHNVWLAQEGRAQEGISAVWSMNLWKNGAEFFLFFSSTVCCLLLLVLLLLVLLVLLVLLAGWLLLSPARVSNAG